MCGWNEHGCRRGTTLKKLRDKHAIVLKNREGRHMENRFIRLQVFADGADSGAGDSATESGSAVGR